MNQTNLHGDVGLLRRIGRELRRLWIPVTLTIVALSGIMSYLSCALVKDYSLQFDLEAWEVGTQWMNLFFPLFAVIPVGWDLHDQRKKRGPQEVSGQMKIKGCLSAKWIACALASFLIFLIPYVVSAYVALYVKPPIVPLVNPFGRTFQSLYEGRPFAYALLLSLWKGLLGVEVMTLGFVTARYVDSLFTVCFLPFLYPILEGIVLSLLRMDQYRLHVCFEPSIIAPYAMAPTDFLTAPSVLAVFILVCWMILSKACKLKIVKP